MPGSVGSNPRGGILPPEQGTILRLVLADIVLYLPLPIAEFGAGRYRIVPARGVNKLTLLFLYGNVFLVPTALHNQELVNPQPLFAPRVQKGETI